MTQSLGTAITISKGKKHEVSESPSSAAKRLIGIDDLRNDNLLRYTNDKKGIEATPEDVLIAWDGANAGTIGYGKKGFIGSTIARLRIKPESKLFAPFLGLYLKSQFDYLRKTATGATIPHINRKALESIPLPKIEPIDQIRIAHLLGKVEGLIAQRKQHLQRLDDLLKSVFLEMFSPSADGYENWPLVEIKDLAEKHKGAMRTGPFGSNLLHSEFSEDGEVAVLGIDNAVQNRFAWGERRYITQEKYQELQNYRIYAGDVIVTIMGTIGRSAVIPNDIPLAINTKHLAAITLNKKIANPIFVSYSIHSSPYILNQFKSKNRGAIMSGLNLGLIKETKLKRPPIGAQNKFATIHEKVDEVKRSYQQSLFELESLYGALSQQAFKGELDLSKVPLPTAIPSEFGMAPPQEALEQLSRAGLDEYPMSSPEGRNTLLRRLFEQFLSSLDREDNFKFDVFWNSAHRNSLDYMDDDSAPFGLADYELLKEWGFEALNSGRLQQVQNVTGQDDKGEKILGNKIELKVGVQP
jgi:type I restriction enzyme S subunit